MISRSDDDDRPVTGTEPLPKGLAGIARRIARRTTDLIVVGIVLIGGLTFGRQAVEWWRAEPEAMSPGPATADSLSPWNAAPVEIEFGNAPLSLTRMTVAGDQEAAMNRLTAECRKIAEDPAGMLLESPAAEAIVSRLSKLAPVESGPGGWSVYRLDDPFPLVAAVRQGPPSEGEADLKPPRLICFGVAVSAAASESTLFLFRGAEGESTDDAWLHTSEFVPEGFHRLLGLRGQNGEYLVGITGRTEPADWQASLEAKLRARGWGLRGNWSVAERTCSAKFGRQGDDGGTLNVVMTSDEAGGWTGLIHQSP